VDDAEIIRKVRTEHERLTEITASLREAVESPATGDPAHWLHKVVAEFERYRAHLIHRIAVEEMGGFLNIVVERNPTLSAQVEHLRRTHEEMIAMAGETMTALRKLDAADRKSVDHAALLVRMALSEVAAQEQAECLLVSFVFTQEIGVGD
jgi:hypothetical protein